MVGLGVSNVAVRLAGRDVLQDISLTLKPGELLAILGPNGAGKSTLLNVLSGEQSPHAGLVRLDGTALHDFAPMALARNRALMPQRASLAFPFKVGDVVAMGRDPFRADRDAPGDRQAVAWALAETDTTHLEHRTYTRLSGGEQQRVQLARVLAQVWRRDGEKPGYLLLDEPTSSLDLAHQHTTLQLARELADRGVGVAAVVHDLNLAALYASRAAILRQGRLAALGEPDEILVPETVARIFGLSVHQLRDSESGRSLIVPTGVCPSHEQQRHLQ